MQNRWVMNDNGFVEWYADLSRLVRYPEQLVVWLQRVFEAAETEAVHTIDEADRLNFRRAEHGAFSSYIQTYYDQTGIVDLGAFSLSGSVQAWSKLSYYNEHDQIVEEDVADVGNLWLQCHPEAKTTAASLWYHLPALNITGPAIPTRDPERFTIAINRLQAYVSIRLYSDIWFPWIVGLIDETHDLAKRFDNRVLAQRHTSRLNRFLAVAREATLALNCSWSLNRDRDALRSDYHFMVNDEGIDLEAHLPDELTVNDGLAQPDKLSEAKAALQVIDAIRANPYAPRPEVIFRQPPSEDLGSMLDKYAIPWRVESHI